MLPSLVKNLVMMKILTIKVKIHEWRKKNWKGLDMIIYMSSRDENLRIPIPWTFCLCLDVGNDFVNKSAKL